MVVRGPRSDGALWRRGRDGRAGRGSSCEALGRIGVLVPHARLLGLKEPLIAVGRFAKAPPVPTPDGTPLRLVFLILTPLETPTMQLKVLQRIASLVTNETLRRKILRAKTDESLLTILRTADTLLAT